jgi:hypothetical protein
MFFKEKNMNFSEFWSDFGWLVIAVVLIVPALIIGWKPVTKKFGPSNIFRNFTDPSSNSSSRSSTGALDMGSLASAVRAVGRCCHLSFKIVLSVLSGYFFLIVFIVKFISARIASAKEKKAGSDNTQNSSEGNNATNV